MNLSSYFKDNDIPIQVLKLEHILKDKSKISHLTKTQRDNTWVLLSNQNTKLKFNAGNAILVRLNIINKNYLKQLTKETHDSMRINLEKNVPDSISSSTVLLTKHERGTIFNINTNIFCIHDNYALKPTTHTKYTKHARRVEESDIIEMLNS